MTRDSWIEIVVVSVAGAIAHRVFTWRTRRAFQRMARRLTFKPASASVLDELIGAAWWQNDVLDMKPSHAAVGKLDDRHAVLGFGTTYVENLLKSELVSAVMTYVAVEVGDDLTHGRISGYSLGRRDAYAGGDDISLESIELTERYGIALDANQDQLDFVHLFDPVTIEQLLNASRDNAPEFHHRSGWLVIGVRRRVSDMPVHWSWNKYRQASATIEHDDVRRVVSAARWMTGRYEHAFGRDRVAAHE